MVLIVLLLMYTRPPLDLLSYFRRAGLLLVLLVHIRSSLDDCNSKWVNHDNAHPLEQLDSKTMLIVNANNRMLRVLARRVARSGGVVIQTCPPHEEDKCGDWDADYDDDGYMIGSVMSIINILLGRSTPSSTPSNTPTEAPSSAGGFIDTMAMQDIQIYKYKLDLGNFTDIERFSGLIGQHFAPLDMVVLNTEEIYTNTYAPHTDEDTYRYIHIIVYITTHTRTSFIPSTHMI